MLNAHERVGMVCEALMGLGIVSGGLGVMCVCGTLAHILHEPRAVPRLDPLVRRMEVWAVTGLIAEAPEENGRMVLVSLHHRHRALEVRQQPLLLSE